VKLIFSKGGFVSFPVVLAGKILGIPSIIHESDLSPGLSNRLCFPFAQAICLTFQETSNCIKKYQKKCINAGSIFRDEAFTPDPQKARDSIQLFCKKKIILVYGGGSGSTIINETLRAALPHLLKKYSIVHLCGKGKLEPSLKQKNYFQFEYLDKNFYDFLALADLVVSRSGSNTVNELLFFRKPHILIPLSKKSSRGEQIINAQYFHKKYRSMILEEENLNSEQLTATIEEAFQKTNLLEKQMRKTKVLNGNEQIYQLLQKTIAS
jgi:UDP-N-acetylglucosamine--N-acetylmuramyl-(pentapeptide) pyrophosphoryl-undecaprenol N-acetylglucosamine transferase